MGIHLEIDYFVTRENYSEIKKTFTSISLNNSNNVISISLDI